MTRLGKFVNTIFAAIFGIEIPPDKSIFSIILDWLAAMYAEFMLIVMRRVEDDFTPVIKGIVERSEATKKLPPELQPLVNEVKAPTKEIAALMGNSIAGGATGGLVSSTLGPYLMLLQYEIQRSANQGRYDPKTGLAIKFRRPDKATLVDSDMRDQGWTAERTDLLEDVARTRLDEEHILNLYRRGQIDGADMLERMRWIGYDPHEANTFMQSSEIWPNVSDLVRMAVREAFTPEIAEKFGQYQDLPAEFMNKAKQVGLSEDFAKAFWAAHWDLPSAQMGFDMLHRGIITQDDLKMLLRALDIMPYWRDKLIQLSYVPFTRVDVRRMHKLGILNEAGVLQAYKDIGYSPEKAADLTKFTIALNSDTATSKEKDLLKSEMIAAYKKRLISAEDLGAWLESHGYAVDESDLIIETSTVTADVAQRDLTLAQVKDLYQKGIRTKLECTSWLSAMKYDASEITALYALWDWEKPATDKVPSRTDLDAFIGAGIITLDDWSAGYDLLGYDMKYQEWYYALLVSKGKVESV